MNVDMRLGPLPTEQTITASPAAADALRRDESRLVPRALESALARDPSLRDRYDDRTLAVFLRDEREHLAELVRSLDTGEDRWLVSYVMQLVPVMRRRHVPMRDFATLLLGLRDAAIAVLAPEDADRVTRVTERAIAELDRPRHLPGERRRGRLASILWKASGLGGW